MAVSKVILNGETLIDVTQKTVAPSNMLSGITALKNDGTDITGSISAKSAADLITSGSQVTVPSGMYAAAASTAIASGSIKASGLSINPGIGTFSLDSSTGVVTIDRPKASGTVYATITSAGYLDATASDSDIVTISSNSKTYALPIVSAAIITPTESSRVAVASGKFTTGSITVAAIPSSYVGSNVPRRTSSDVVVTTLSFSSNSRYDYIDSTVTWSSGFYENDGRKSYLKNILDVQELPSQSAITIVPTESSQIAVASRRWLKGDVTVAAISSSYVGSAVARRGATDLTASGSVITVPSGYYTADVSKAVAAAAYSTSFTGLLTPTIAVDSTGMVTVIGESDSNLTAVWRSGYIERFTLRYITTVNSSYQLPVKTASDLSADGSVVTVPSGYYTADVSKAVAAGSITIPSHSFDIKPDITLNSATGKIDLWKSLSYTIPVSLTSGYIAQASGPRVAATVDSSYQLPVKAAATIVPSTADQVVASGYFLTGAQTIKGDSALTPSNIAAGVSIFGIEGTHQGGGNLQDNKTVTPTSEQQIVLPDTYGSPTETIPVGTRVDNDGSNVIRFACSTLPSETKYIQGEIQLFRDDGGAVLRNIGKITIDGVHRDSNTIDDIITVEMKPDYSWIQISTWWYEYPSGIVFNVHSTEVYALYVTQAITFTDVYDGLKQVTVNAVAATTSYYLAQDSQGYITYSSIMPSGGEYYIFNVAGIKHIEDN